jgi:PAS domain S-box-containing protein
MNGQYAYTPYIWPSVGTVLLLIILSVYSWFRRSTPGAIPFLVACLFAAAWVIGSIMVYSAVDLVTKIFWFKFQAAWSVPIITAVTCFILEYTWPGRWLTRRVLVLLYFPCLLVVGLILTDDLHHLMWRSLEFEGSLLLRPGLAWWIAVAYALGLLGIVNIIVFAWLFLRSPQHRWPVFVMFTGQIVGRTVYLLQAVDLIRSNQPLDVLGMAFEFLIYAIALFGFHIFDPISLARQTVIAQMQDGMLVLDSQGRVASLNTAAERILDTTAKQSKGKRVRDLLPDYPNGKLTEVGENEIELRLPAGREMRQYATVISLLKDFRELAVGRLLLLRDVTEQKRAQAQTLEQQRALAMLQERERLARELHDSLGQTLAAVHLQASTARMLLAQGETAQTDKYLEQLADMTIAAEADVREYLLGAKAASSSDHLFFQTLREYAARFSQKYGLRVELSVPPQLEAQGLGAAVEVQLLRIIQEALSNVRKHACAKNVQVVFTVLDSLAQIAIMDDGQGFEPAVALRRAEGFGLQAMRERAEALGGRLELVSQPSRGTQVVVQVQIQQEEGPGEKQVGR